MQVPFSFFSSWGSTVLSNRGSSLAINGIKIKQAMRWLLHHVDFKTCWFPWCALITLLRSSHFVTPHGLVPQPTWSGRFHCLSKILLSNLWSENNVRNIVFQWHQSIVSYQIRLLYQTQKDLSKFSDYISLRMLSATSRMPATHATGRIGVTVFKPLSPVASNLPNWSRHNLETSHWIAS